MPDPRFFAAAAPITAVEAAALVGAGETPTQVGDIHRVASLAEDNIAGAVVYCAGKDTLAQLADRAFGLCLTTPALAASVKGDGVILGVESPKRAFAILAARLHHSLEETEPDAGGEPLIAADAEIHASTSVGAGAEIGAGARIGPHCRIGRGVVIGEGARIESGVSVTHAILGRNVHILAGARVGQAGFGFAESENGPMRVPQLGRVIIEDDVEIGANTTIDRGMLGDTVLGAGTKIDNLVHIGHNTRVGRYCVIAAQSGIAGSCVVGDGVMMGGQVGVSDHLHIGDGAQLGARAGVMRDVPAGEKWSGYPARKVKRWLRETAVLAKLARKKNG